LSDLDSASTAIEPGSFDPVMSSIFPQSMVYVALTHNNTDYLWLTFSIIFFQTLLMSTDYDVD